MEKHFISDMYDDYLAGENELKEMLERRIRPQLEEAHAAGHAKGYNTRMPFLLACSDALL